MSCRERDEKLPRGDGVDPREAGNSRLEYVKVNLEDGI